MGYPKISHFEREQQLRQACAEMDRRLRAGEDCITESILAAAPIVAEHKDSTVELLYTEFAVRDELGLGPKPSDWYSRFPNLRHELQELFDVHRFICDSAVIASSDTTQTESDCLSTRSTLPDSKVPGIGILGANPSRSDHLPFGEYELIREIGRGAMGVVYEARQSRLNRIVAIKMILDGELAGPDQLERFRVECAAVARMQHPNVVQIFEVGEQAGRAFCSLEFVDGGGLDRLLARARPTVREAAELVETLAKAIGYVHERGVVHRDLKPANVLLQPVTRASITKLPETAESQSQDFPLTNCVPKITDFGLAKKLEGEEIGGTRSRAIIGTLGYMAPEQAIGGNRKIGPAADVHALGAILYETLVGHPPFQAATFLETLEQVRGCPPVPPTRLERNIPRDLETICLKCLEKDPSRRYFSAMALAEDLRRFLNHETIHARPTRTVERFASWCRRKPLVAGLLATLAISLLAGVGGIVSQWQRAEHQAALARQQSFAAQAERNIAVTERARAEENLHRARELVDRLTRIADSLTDQPQMEDAHRTALEETLVYYHSFVENNPSEPKLRLEAVRACVRVGSLQDRLGKIDLAEKTLRKGIRLIQEGPAEFVSTSDWLLELARCLAELGHVQRSKNQFVEAVASYTESIQILSRLRKQSHRDKSVCESLLANVLMNQAVALRALDRQNDAETALRQAIELQATVLQTRPINPWNRMGVALALDDLGGLLVDQGRWSDATPYCEQALSIRLEVSASAPAVASHREHLARSHHNMGKIHAQATRSELAIKSFREAVRITDKLARDFPSRIFYRTQLVSSAHHLGLLLTKSGRSAEAVESYQLGLRADPVNAGLLNALAWIKATSDDLELRDLNLAIEFAEKATLQKPDLQSYWNTLGVAQYRNGDWHGAANSLQRSMNLPAGDHCYNWLFLAMTNYQLDQPDDTARWYQKAVVWMEQNHPTDQELLRFRKEADATLQRGL